MPITNDKVEYAVFIDGQKTQILIYAQDFDYGKDEEYNIDITINCEIKKLTRQIIDDTHCNPKAEWVKLGCPDLLTPAQVEEIKDKTKLKIENQEFLSTEGQTLISVKLHSNDVLLLTLE